MCNLLNETKMFLGELGRFALFQQCLLLLSVPSWSCAAPETMNLHLATGSFGSLLDRFYGEPASLSPEHMSKWAHLVPQNIWNMLMNLKVYYRAIRSI